MTEEEQKQLLNDIDQGVIGAVLPKVTVRREHYPQPGQFEGTDNMPNDPEQAGWEDHDN